MSEGIAATINPDLRARSTFLPYCPLCSHLGHDDQPDILRGPNYREVVLPVNRNREVAETVVKIDQCCSISATIEAFEDRAEASAWWRKARLEPVRCTATNNRRICTLSKLSAKGLEPITAADAQRDSHQD